jgi:transcriptional regulator with XRE-family HTH domain
MAARNDPARCRYLLATELSLAREAAGLTQIQTVNRLDWSPSKLARIEAGTTAVSVTDVTAMLELYQVTDHARAERLREAARGSRGQPWWSPYQDVVPANSWHLSLEPSATSIRVAHPYLIPELLHTPGYATAVLEGIGETQERSRRLAELLAERQQRLFGTSGPPALAFVVGEEALRRPAGEPAVWRRQLRHLVDITARQAATISIVPLSVGVHPALRGPFFLLSIDGPARDILFTGKPGWYPAGHKQEHDQELVTRFGMYFEASRRLSLPDDQARVLIEELADRHGSNGDT